MIIEKPNALIAVDETGRGEVFCSPPVRCPSCGHNAKQLTVYDGKTTCSNCPEIEVKS